jgi:1,2-diacylglycerol-3-alpha-glucose alpha-1,2-glucosyltransferase
LLSPDRVIVWPDRHPFLEDRPTKYFDVLLSPSLSEVQPLVVLEALISGVPVVATLSSPFFDEFSEQIRAFGLAGPSCTTVPIPARFASGDLTRADLALTSDELDDVAPRLFDLIAKTRVPSDIERHELAAKVINAGYTPKAMTAKLAVLYQRAEDMHNARTQLRADDR